VLFAGPSIDQLSSRIVSGQRRRFNSWPRAVQLAFESAERVRDRTDVHKPDSIGPELVPKARFLAEHRAGRLATLGVIREIRVIPFVLSATGTRRSLLDLSPFCGEKRMFTLISLPYGIQRRGPASMWGFALFPQTHVPVASGANRRAQPSGPSWPPERSFLSTHTY